MTKQMSPFADFEQVGRSAMKVALRTGGDGVDGAARKVTFGQDFPLAPPPPVQFVLCFDERLRDGPVSAGQTAIFVGFSEENGEVSLLPMLPGEVAIGLSKLATLMRQIDRAAKLSTEK